MRLFLVGAGTPTPTADRFGTCYVVHAGEQYLMFDCGPAATHKLVKAGIFPTQIEHLFFTHHHYDHNVDYPCFLLTRWNHETGDESRLHVWGPPPTVDITERLIGAHGAFLEDWEARVNHPGSQEAHMERGGKLPRPGPSFIVTDIEPGARIDGAGWSLTATAARHVEPWLRSLAYRLDTDEGSIGITGDAVATESLNALMRGVDTLVVNVWNHQRVMQADRALHDVIAGTEDAAELARDAGARRLVIAHALANLTRPGSRERGIADMASVFDGEIVFGDELMVLDL
jgi:ribonuclease Z